MNSYFIQTAHREPVQAPESLESPEDALNTGTDCIDFLPLLGGLRHLVAARVPLNDRYSIVGLHYGVIGLGVVSGVRQDIHRLESSDKLHRWFDLLGVRIIGGSDVSAKWDFVHRVGNQVGFVSRTRIA